jgi:hypothetical protein
MVRHIIPTFCRGHHRPAFGCRRCAADAAWDRCRGTPWERRFIHPSHHIILITAAAISALKALTIITIMAMVACRVREAVST